MKRVQYWYEEMFKKFMVDSVTYWATEYHLDGFRFDLMGLHDCDTMDAVREALDKIDTRIITYGEGWSLGSSTDKYNWAGNKTVLCTQVKATRVNERIGFFNDDARDALKGKAFDDLTSSGFVSGAKSFARPLFDSIKGHFTTANWKTQVPGQNVMYSCCHDNQTLYDRLVATNFGVETDQYGVRRESLVSNNKLAGAIVMTSQGIPFILAGEEFARTKYGDHNSYKSSPDINMLDWSRAADYADIVSYYKGLISLRKNFDAFSDGTQTTGESLTMMQDLPAGVIGYEIKNLASAKNQWSSALVYFNASLDEEQEIVLPGGAPVGAQPVPGILEGIVMGAEIQALVGPEQAEAVHEHLGAVLHVVLPEDLLGLLVRGRSQLVNGRQGIVEEHAAGLGGIQLVDFGQHCAVQQRILQFPYYGVRFVVYQGRTKAHQPVFQCHGKGNLHVQFLAVSEKFFIAQGYHIPFLRHFGDLFTAQHLDFLLVGGVVIQAPQIGARGIVRPGGHVGQRGQIAFRGNAHAALPVLQRLRLCKAGESPEEKR